MARKLNSDEVDVFAEAVSSDSLASGADAELILDSLKERRDEALKLTPESSFWFGDKSPWPFGSNG